MIKLMRVVDPLFLGEGGDAGEMIRLSEVDPNWAGVLKKDPGYREYWLRFV